MVGSCGTYEEGERFVLFSWGNLRERDHFEDLGVDGDNIKIDFQEIEWGRQRGCLTEHVEDFRPHFNVLKNIRLT